MKPIFEFQDVAQQLRRRKGVNSLDKRALLAILDDRPEDGDHLLEQMRRRNELGISVVAGSNFENRFRHISPSIRTQ
ncbi:hypothetical protein [Acidithiobacillus ferrooxidans]|uniref:hypothetical protein n=1 Tax=Acidithiobacillus ferrooxidans TaxID=920 RepID=UPI000ADC5E35|nr:hypothetical protein [Acidithiobacillus ferrooxidans]